MTWTEAADYALVAHLLAPAQPAAPVDPQQHLKTAVDLPEIPGRTPAWQHQRQAYWWALPKRAAYIAIPMGGGKSKLAVALIEGRDHDNVLILAPKSVVPGWGNQFAVHGTRDTHVVALNGRWPIDKRVAQAKQAIALASVTHRPCVIVTNYESLLSKTMAAFIHDARFDLVVCDELHKLKSHAVGGMSGILWKTLRGQDCHRLGLSGTPLPHSMLDGFAQMRFLDETVFGTGWTRFRSRYSVPHPMFPSAVKEFINQDEFARKLAPYLFQVDRAVLDLPPAHHVVRPVELESKTLTMYRTLEKDFYLEVESGEVTAALALTRLLRLQQLTGGYLKSDAGDVLHLGDEKRAALADTLDGLPQREPVVVFCRFRKDLDVVRDVAEAQGRRYGEVSGRRSDLVSSRMPDDVDVLGAQLQAGGVGVDFSRAAYCIYYSLGFSLSDYVQSLARTHRPGQTRPVTYIHLTATSTVDEKVYRALDARQEVIQSVMGLI